MTSGFNLGFVAGRPRRFLYAWGNNAGGQTGLGTTSGNTLNPTLVGTTRGWSRVAGARGWSAGIRGRRLFGWGVGGPSGTGALSADSNVPGQNGADFDWFEIAAAGSNSVGSLFFPRTLESHAVGVNGDRLFSYGQNSNGATGFGTTSGSTNVPTQVGSATGWTAVAAAASNIGSRDRNFSLAILNGELYAFGSNNSGATGLGTGSGDTTTPTRVGSDSDWTVVACGFQVSLGIRNGELYSWGSNSNGATGLGTTSGNTTTPTRVGSATGWTAIAVNVGNGTASQKHCLGVLNGELYAWGNNVGGITGLGTTSGNTTTPTKVGALTGWTAVACGVSHSLAIRNGELYAWGENLNGQTGLGTSVGLNSTPVRVGSSSDWLHIAAGFLYSFGVKRKI